MTQDFDSIYAHVTNTLTHKGLPAAVRVITRIYEESDPTNPWASFNMGSSTAAVHIARWVAGHDKTGKKSFEPRSVSDPRFNDSRFKKIISGHLPPGETPERLVMAIALENIPGLVQILHAENQLQGRAADDREERVVLIRKGAQAM
jgi:hypothetical protein